MMMRYTSLRSQCLLITAVPLSRVTSQIRPGSNSFGSSVLIVDKASADFCGGREATSDISQTQAVWSGEKSQVRPERTVEMPAFPSSFQDESRCARKPDTRKSGYFPVALCDLDWLAHYKRRGSLIRQLINLIKLPQFSQSAVILPLIVLVQRHASPQQFNGSCLISIK